MSWNGRPLNGDTVRKRLWKVADFSHHRSLWAGRVLLRRWSWMAICWWQWRRDSAQSLLRSPGTHSAFSSTWKVVLKWWCFGEETLYSHIEVSWETALFALPVLFGICSWKGRPLISDPVGRDWMAAVAVSLCRALQLGTVVIGRWS